MSSAEENKLPDGWKNVRLDSIGLFIRGVSYKKHQLLNEYVDGCITLLRANNIQNGLYLNDFQYLPNGFIKEDKITKDGDILLAMSSGSKNLVGKNTKLPKLSNFSFGAFCSIYRLNDTNQSNYVSLFFQSPYYDSIISNLFRGAGINNLRSSDLDSVVIPIPPLQEQKRIVAKIDNLFAKIDKAIRLTEESLKQAKNLLPSSVKKLFEDGETKGWKKLKFKDFASLRHGHQFRKYDYVENGIPVVKIGQCIPGDRLDLTKCNFIDKSRETEFSNDLICKGDLLMALTGGTLGKVTWVKDDYGVVVQNYRVGNFFTDEKLCSKRFLMYALLSPIFQTLMYSKINVAAQPNIGKEEIENLEFILPSLEEQSKVVDRLDNLTFKVKQTQSKLEQQLAYLKQLKSSILCKAFKGDL